MFIHVEPVASASTAISTYTPRVYGCAAGGPRRPYKEKPPPAKADGGNERKKQSTRGWLYCKKGRGSPKPAEAATSEQWTKFTGLRVSPNPFLIRR